MSGFAFGSEFTVGIEEELLLVDPTTLELAPVAGEVLAGIRVEPEGAGHEAYAAQIELRSPPSDSAAEAAARLAERRLAALEAGATLIGAGVHPTGRLGDAELVPTRRYERVADEMRGLLRRTPESALHVHVGMPDGESAVRGFNALRRHMPLLLGLSANSPWWFGRDSGLASARSALVRAYPGRGIPEALRDMAEAEERIAAMVIVAGAPEPTFLWWDLRLHPTHGTIEVREMDAQSSLEGVASLAALVRVLAVEAQDAPPAPRDASEVLDWSAFRAGRDGTEASILDEGRLRPLADVARHTVARLRPIARTLGDDDALDGIARLLEQGGGAGRQRSAEARGGVRGMLRMLVEDTADTSLARPRAGRFSGRPSG